MSGTLGTRWGSDVSSCYGRATPVSRRRGVLGERGLRVAGVEPVDEAADDVLAAAAAGGRTGAVGHRLDTARPVLPGSDDVLLRHPVAPAHRGGARHPHRRGRLLD